MKYDYRLWCILIIMIGMPEADGQESMPKKLLSFEQAYELTMQNSHLMKQTQHIREEKSELSKAAKGLYLPKVGISASYMLLPENLTLDLSPVRDAITPLYSALGNYGVFSGVPNPDPATQHLIPVLPDNTSTQVVRGQLQQGLDQVQRAEWDRLIQKKQFGTLAATFQWPLYAGGKIQAANRAAAIDHSETNEMLRQREGELLSELVERYYGLSLARQAVLLRSDVLKGMERHLFDAEKMHRDGLIANAEVLQARLYHAQADRELKKAYRTAGIMNDALNNTLASGSSEEIETVSSLFYLDSIAPVEYFLQTATLRNPALQIVEGRKQLAGVNQRIHQSEYLPSLAVQGMYDIANKDLSPYSPEWMVGVGLKWTLFDGTARYHKVKSAAARTNQVIEIQEKAQTDVATMIYKLYNELNSYREQLAALGSAQVFAEEYLRVREKGFREEMSNATEVTDARMALAQVRTERLQAIYGYDLVLAKLLQYSGIPEEFNSYKTSNLARTEVYQPMN
jgi:outer membrane protein TolC